jgi:exopolysaccharide biosynthesis polyprenyl glycosylphosphotransferase
MTACEVQPSAAGVASSTARGHRQEWETVHRRALLVIDIAAALFAGFVGYIIRPGGDNAVWGPTTYTLVSVLLPAACVAIVAGLGGYTLWCLGDAGAESRNVLTSIGSLLAAISWITWATSIQVPRDYILLVLTTICGLMLGVRVLSRQWLKARRSRGECVQRILAVGQPSAVTALIETLGRVRDRRAVVVGCCSVEPFVARQHPEGPADVAGPVPTLGGVEEVASAMETVEADTVAVLPCPELGATALRRLAWAVEGRAAHFVVIPGLADVVQPRLHVGPVGGLAALHVEHARLSGPALAVKGLVDRVVALSVLVLLAPVLLGIAMLIRATSAGPAIFRQTRVGVNGRAFGFIKFRTMYVGAADSRAELANQNINGDGLLFKVRNDPRVTPVGAFLRRWSLDELPQLVNVVLGDMSLIGPRPPLPEEVAKYGDDVRRRLAVKPGLTGLWQISGRSDLSWDDAVRLDLHYVDNWSLGMDATILIRTIPAVLQRTGAY